MADSRIKQITELRKKALELDNQARKIGESYMYDNTKYKRGQKIILKERSGVLTYGIIKRISFGFHSTLSGFAALQVSVWKTNWKEEAVRRNPIFIDDSDNYEILDENHNTIDKMRKFII